MPRPKLRITTFRIGDPPRRGEGLRIGTTRRPPRGVPRSRWTRDGYFDVWLPIVAPSLELLRRARERDFDDAAVRRAFFRAYRRELESPQVRQAVELLARVAARTPIAVGCFCEDPRRCHRTVLVNAIKEAANHLPSIGVKSIL